MKSAIHVIALVSSLVFIGCAGLQDKKVRDVPVAPGKVQETKHWNQDAQLLSETGIDLGKYGYRLHSGDPGYDYLLLTGSNEEFRKQAERIVNAADALHASMPSVMDVVKEFGLPPRITVTMHRSMHHFSLYYGEDTMRPPIGLIYGSRTANLVEIRLAPVLPDYRFRGRLSIGSTFGEVFDALGMPMETVTGQERAMLDRVFTEATVVGETDWQYIAYAAEGVGFFGRDDKVVALHLFDPKGPVAELLREAARSRRSRPVADAAPFRGSRAD